MAKINVEYVFELENGGKRAVTVKDLKDDIGSSEMTAFADLLIEKNSHHNGFKFTSLVSCVKYTVDEEVIV